MKTAKWLVFISQLPAQPSSPRVMVWRRMRNQGAAGPQNGVWLFPNTPDQLQFLRELVDYVDSNDGTSYLFEASDPAETSGEVLEAIFNENRTEEYLEFTERCREMLAEIEKETGQEKFTFAELEENERDLDKFEQWQKQIQSRDFFNCPAGTEAQMAFAACQAALREFSRAVYAQQGIDSENGDRV